MTTHPERADVSAIRRQFPIEDIVRAAGVELRPAGHGFVGCCPFHDDSTPSMSVGGVPDRFTCFGCGAHGDVIDFVQQLHNLSFIEAVRRLTTDGQAMAPRLPPRIPTSRPAHPMRVVSPERAFQINAYAWEHFSRPVAAGFADRYLLNHRGLDLRRLRAEQPAAPLAGHAGHGWTSLTDDLMSRGVTGGEMLAMDLSQRTRRGRLVDTMRDRIIFPVTYPDHRILGFIGRDVTGNDHTPKYRNPTKTPTFDKSAVLYRPTHHALSPQGTVVVVEGVIDALAIAAAASAVGRSAEFAPCTASGVGVTSAQAVQVMGLAREANCVIALDGDEAGAEGTRRWLRQLSIDRARLALVARLPDGLDPADWIRHRGSAGLAAFDGAATARLVGSARPTLPGRELAQIAVDGVGSPITKATHYIVRLAAHLPALTARELIEQAEREMTRQGWNPDGAFSQAIRRYPDVAHAFRPPPVPAASRAPLALRSLGHGASLA